MTTSIFENEAREVITGKIADRLAKANGNRRERTVSLSRVLECLRVVRGGESFARTDGGSVPSSYGYRAITTHALAAKVGGKYFLGITTGDAIATSPGRAWSELQPWRTGEGPTGDAEFKWQAWSSSPSVVELSAAEIDLIRD